MSPDTSSLNLALGLKPTPLVVSLSELPDYVDRLSFDAFQVELAMLWSHLQVLLDNFTVLSTLGNLMIGNHSDSSGGSGSSTGGKKQNVRLGEQVMMVTKQALRKLIGSTSMPDGEFISIFVKDIRGRVKVVEDMANSTKLALVPDGKGSSVNVSIRTCLARISHALECLEIEYYRQSHVLDFLTELKQRVHGPVQTIILEMNELVQIKHGATAATRGSTHKESAKPLKRSNASILLDEAEAAYQAARVNPTLVRAGEAHLETLLLAEHMEKTVAPLRKAIQGVASTDTQADAALSSLRRILMLRGEEFLASLMASEQLRESLAVALLELESRGAKVLRSNKELNDAVENFDIDLFLAYLKDWMERVNSLADQEADVMFTEAIRQLEACRTYLEDAMDHSAKAISTEDSVSSRFLVLKRQMLELKVEVEMLCQVELNGLCEIQVPMEMPSTPVALPIEENPNATVVNIQDTINNFLTVAKGRTMGSGSGSVPHNNASAYAPTGHKAKSNKR